jgi:hypothetical protein
MNKYFNVKIVKIVILVNKRIISMKNDYKSVLLDIRVISIIAENVCHNIQDYIHNIFTVKNALHAYLGRKKILITVFCVICVT